MASRRKDRYVEHEPHQHPRHPQRVRPNRITRQAGKRVLLHGEFGSRHITFTDKLKRDECLHLLMAGNSRRRTLMQELE